MKTKISFFALILSFISSCDSNYGELVVRDGVQVFYLSPIEKKDAESLADYWLKNKLTTTQTQYLQLSENQNIIQLKLIPNDSTFLVEIPFDVQIELTKLDSMLNADLFEDKELQLFLSDKTFSKTKSLF
jgi:hypothetical protein